ncbi:MAG: type II secretion system minor pseudopilin GspH [Gammaproteobacteria bacterium]|nr:type II secretion system minor pseudopilin GspH [Gammaproteobacteria bacterium]
MRGERTVAPSPTVSNHTLTTVAARTQSGFTLIELLVVVTIIGILIGFVSINVTISGDAKLKKEAKRLAAVVQLASEEAILNSANYVVRLARSKYELAVLDDNGKHVAPEGDDKLFALHELPEGLRLNMEINGEPVSLSAEFDEDYQNVPVLYLLASGELTPFIANFEMDTDKGVTRQRVKGEFNGQVHYLGNADGQI